MIKGFSLDIYDCDIAFAWDTNEKELNGLLDKAGATDEDRKDFFDHIRERDLQAVTVGMGTTLIAIVFKCEPTEKVVAHEIFHAAYRCLQARGIEDEESYAYTIGHITGMFYELFRSDEPGDSFEEPEPIK